jgi:hypothetical protein
MAKLSGTIYRKGTKEPIPGALVKATAKDKNNKVGVADEDGDYVLEIDPGSWTIVALNEKSFPSDEKKIDLMQDKSGFDMDLPRLSGEEDSKSGIILFWVLFGLLIAFVIIYIAIHLITPTGKLGQFQFWDVNPLRYLEIILWGFGGILVNKIISVGGYLRFQRFYREGIIMHISHLLVTPLLVLVVILLLSLATLSITLAGNSLTLDLSKPEVFISLAFILGTIPWPLWKFIEDTGKRFADSVEKK